MDNEETAALLSAVLALPGTLPVAQMQPLEILQEMVNTGPVVLQSHETATTAISPRPAHEYAMSDPEGVGSDHGNLLESVKRQTNDPRTDTASLRSPAGFLGPDDATKLRARYPTSDDWDRHQLRIHKLYVHENRTLAEVMEIMEREYLFKATKRMFCTRIRQWGFKKNMKDLEMKAILRMATKRAALGKCSSFRIRGHPISANYIRRYLKQEGIKDNDCASPATSRPVTPSGVVCSTPEPASGNTDEVFDADRRLHSADMDGSTLCDTEPDLLMDDLMTDDESFKDELHNSSCCKVEGLRSIELPECGLSGVTRLVPCPHPTIRDETNEKHPLQSLNFIMTTMDLGIKALTIRQDHSDEEARHRSNACRQFFEKLGTALKYMDRGQYGAGGPILQESFSRIRQILTEADALIMANLIKLSIVLYRRGRYEIWGILSQYIRDMTKVLYGERHPLCHILARLDQLSTQMTNEVADSARRSMDFHLQSAIMARHWRSPVDSTSFFLPKSPKSHSKGSNTSPMATEQPHQPCWQALYSYVSDSQQHLSFHEGDEIIMHQQRSDGWWYGAKGDALGWFPSTYCALLVDSSVDLEGVDPVSISHEPQDPRPPSIPNTNGSSLDSMPSTKDVNSEVAVYKPPSPHHSSLNCAPLSLDLIKTDCHRAREDRAEELFKLDTPDCEREEVSVNLADANADTSAGISSPCPTLTGNSVHSSEYTQSCTDDDLAGISADYRRRLIALASALASYWHLRIGAEVLQSGAGQFRACPSIAQEADDRNTFAGGGQSRQSASKDKCGKRKRPLLEQDNEDDECDDGSNRREKRNTSNQSTALNLLACPFNKSDPARYSELNVYEKEYRGCASVYLSDISRLKQHLYRVHIQPKHYCGSCYEVFCSQNMLNTHTRKRPPCDVAQPLFTERISDDQLATLRQKQYGRTMAENWYTIFGIIFPDSPRPYSPYLEDASQEQVRSYLGFYRQITQTSLLQMLDLDAAGQQAVNFVLEQSMTQVLRRLTREHAPRDGMQDPGFMQIEDSIAQPEQVQMQYFDQFTNVIDNQMGQILQLSEHSIFPSSYARPYEVMGSSRNQVAGTGAALGYVSAGPPPMPAPLCQELYGLPPRDNLDTTKNVGEHVLASWNDPSFSFLE